MTVADSPIDPFTRYLTYTPDALVTSLAQVSTDLARTHLDLANVMVEKERARMISYGQPATSVKAMELSADIAASSANEEVMQARGVLAALLVEHDFLLFLLNRDSKDLSHGAV